MLTKWRAERLLKSLGNSPEDVAMYLELRGITGVRSTGKSCPIANLLKQKFDKVLVGVSTASIGNIKVDVPDPVQTFILHFDRGEYPELDRYRTDYVHVGSFQAEDQH